MWTKTYTFALFIVVMSMTAYAESSNIFSDKSFFKKQDSFLVDECAESRDPSKSIAKYLGSLNVVAGHFVEIPKIPACSYSVAELKDPYSKEYCEKISSCSKKKLNSSSKTQNKQIQESLAEFDLQERLGKVIVKMERVEKVKRFAEKKGMKDIGNCKSKFKISSTISSNKCSQRLNNVFLSMSAYKQSGNYEFYKDYADETANLKYNKFIGYFNKRVEYATDHVINNKDTINIDELARILSDSKKTNEEKSKSFIEKVSVKDRSYDLDPILSYQNSSLDAVHENFLVNIFKDQTLSFEAAKNKILKYREDRTREILKGETCNSDETIDALCEKTNEVVSGKQLPKNLFEARDLLRSENITPNEALLKKVNDTFFSGNAEEKNYESAKVLLEASRCSVYKFSTVYKREDKDIYYSSKVVMKALIVEVDERGNPIENYNVSTKAASGNSATYSQSEDIDSKTSSENAPLSSAGNFQPLAQLGGSPKARNEPIGDTLVNNDSIVIQPETSVKTNVGNEGISSKVKTDKEIEIENQLSELTRRLELANENINNLQKEKENSAKVLAEKKKIEDLNEQISNLKKEQLIQAQRNTNVASESYARSQDSNVIATKSNSFVPVQEKYFDKPESQRTSSAVENDSASAGSNKIVMVDNTSKKSYDIVLRGDDLSTAITTRISELGIEPFYIEENGILKQIIPIIKDGKIVLNEKGEPTYEIMSKGKVGAKYSIQKVSTNQPITSYGDLTKIDNENAAKEYQRAQYLNLRSVTQEALGKNDK